MNPALLTAASTVLSAAVARPPSYSSAISEPQINSWLNDSQWTVATGSASAKGGAGPVTGLTLPSGSVPLLIAAAVVGLLVWKIKRKS